MGKIKEFVDERLSLKRANAGLRGQLALQGKHLKEWRGVCDKAVETVEELRRTVTRLTEECQGAATLEQDRDEWRHAARVRQHLLCMQPALGLHYKRLTKQLDEQKNSYEERIASLQETIDNLMTSHSNMAQINDKQSQELESVGEALATAKEHSNAWHQQYDSCQRRFEIAMQQLATSKLELFASEKSRATAEKDRDELESLVTAAKELIDGFEASDKAMQEQVTKLTADCAQLVRDNNSLCGLLGYKNAEIGTLTRKQRWSCWQSLVHFFTGKVPTVHA